jgi:hypothetical protein
MKSEIALLTILLATIGLSVPVTAQIRNPSQDFFEQGRVQLEREIESLQGEPHESEQNSQKPRSEPLLEVSPSPADGSTQKPNEGKTPSEKPNEVNNNKSRS